MIGHGFSHIDEGALRVFLDECDEMLHALDAAVLRLEREPTDERLLQEIFRITHTVKSSSATIGHETMAGLAHELESLLSELRSGAMPASAEVIDLLFRGQDALRVLTDEVRTGASGDLDVADLLARLRDLLPADAPGVAPVALAHGMNLVRVAITFAPTTVMPAVRALQVVMALEELGELLWSEPSRESIEVEEVDRRLEAVVHTPDTAEQVHAVLLGVGDIETITAAAVVDADGHAEPPPAARPTGGARGPRGEMATGAGPKGATSCPGGGAATAPQTLTRAAKTVRIDVTHLETLMNLVGELVIDRNLLQNIASRAEDATDDHEFVDSLSATALHLERITNELQTEVMKARMIPVEHVFSRFPRMVRDLARRFGKEVELVIEGADTELDRSVIEEVSEPLIHLLRNAIDHGIETPQERAAAGKTPVGTIRLSARHEAGQIVVVVSDDGRGIDGRRIRRAAIEGGFLSEDESARRDEDEAVNLIFTPGLSTAPEISDVSGRGVGMDVVRTSLERLGGSIGIETSPGAGTAFAIRLPLTLAIVHALLISAESAVYALPLSSVREIVRLEPETLKRINRRLVVNLRGTVLPLLPLAELLRSGGRGLAAWAPAAELSGDRVLAVVVQHGTRQVGLIIDRLVGEQEIVIKPLSLPTGDIDGVAGAAILADGRIAPILYVPGLIQEFTLPGRTGALARAGA
ncbi:MAG TPA: chemotaxis protein CheA [Chloroflexota bacterium]|jgi:two-component system chemotaxis sensor kinase CheA